MSFYPRHASAGNPGRMTDAPSPLAEAHVAIAPIDASPQPARPEAVPP
jgi:hypothetical protein